VTDVCAVMPHATRGVTIQHHGGRGSAIEFGARAVDRMQCGTQCCTAGPGSSATGNWVPAL